ncbi:MAG: adenylyltransferase/cytidyltransferase family protein [Solobacterium sp.]|nr:adenylyltransferase/cytidyltransferase family protein [Solobacterium sp.]
MDDKEYGTGLVMGVFDLFHVGHLNLIRRAKEHCDYLRVGVLSDELVQKFKGHAPVIPQDERMEIIRAVRYVDDVVLIDDNPSRLLEYSRRPFDCYFSGDDYIGNPYFEMEREKLREKGSDLVFLPYTQTTSTTKIVRRIQQVQEERQK